jgi:hypothetical protein
MQRLIRPYVGTTPRRHNEGESRTTHLESLLAMVQAKTNARARETKIGHYQRFISTKTHIKLDPAKTNAERS